jgi:hypothetical protein
MTSKFVEIVPLVHCQGNCISFAAIRWPDFSERPPFGRHSVIFLAIDFPGLRRSGSSSQIINHAQDFPQQFPRHRHFGQLEGDVAAMSHNLGTNLHQLRS